MAKKPVVHHPKSRPSKTHAASAKPRLPKSHPSKDTVGINDAAPSLLTPLELSHYQTLLSIFTQTFGPVLQSDSFPSVLQEVKSALYERDFERAFARPEYLDVYAARWSPTRALGYARVLKGIESALETLLVEKSAGGQPDAGDGIIEEDGLADRIDGEEDRGPRRTLRMLSVGGGAAEIVAFASLLSTLEGGSISGDLSLVDTGPWKDVVERLRTGLTMPAILAKYASAAAREANEALLTESRFRCTFIQQDILAWDGTQLAQALGKDPLLVTLLFTLNELYTSGGIAKTTSFLRRLTMSIPLGSLLLVVDSPGSYSEAAVGKEARRYPMHWLLDHTLLVGDEAQVSPPRRRWEKLEYHDSVWFRVPEALRYPIPLENMRYQMHLYQATATDPDAEG